MKRLTSNKAVSEMNVIELAHNSCYAKDHKARYRDYDTDIDAREQAIKLLDKFAGVPNEFTYDEDFEDFMADSLQYGTDDILGLIAVFYKNVWAMANLRERLKEYEDLEGQGKLLKPPVVVGDMTYNASKLFGRVVDAVVERIEIDADGFWVITSSGTHSFDNFGKSIFLTHEEAEAALKEMSE